MKRFWIRTSLLIWGLILRIAVNGQTPDPFEILFQKFIADTCFKHSVVALCLIDLESGTELLSKNAQISLPPASVMKILTTGAALERLGPGYSYTTEFILDGMVISDTLFGDLVIRGNGDPTLGSSRFPGHANSFEQWVQSCAGLIKSKNIRVIKGKIVADASCYRIPGVGESWSYKDLGNYYGAGVYGLNIYDNTYRLVFKQNPEIGGLTKIESIIPEIPGLEMTNFVVSGPRGSGDQAYIFCAPFQLDAFVKGTIPAGNGTLEIKGSVPNPPLLAVQKIYRAINDSGIDIMEEAEVFFNPYLYRNPEILSSFRSPDMYEIIKVVNMESVNLYAEGIGQELAALMGAASPGEAISQHWIERGIDFSGCHVGDASGLSAENAITAKAMVQIIEDLFKDPRLGSMFTNTLATFGISGTVSQLLRNSPAKGMILAKSGSINRVRNHAGIIITEKNGPKAFCILTYNFHCSPREVTGAISSFLERLYFLCSE